MAEISAARELQVTRAGEGFELVPGRGGQGGRFMFAWAGEHN